MKYLPDITLTPSSTSNIIWEKIKQITPTPTPTPTFNLSVNSKSDEKITLTRTPTPTSTCNSIEKLPRVFISGTGRSGTTFLIMICSIMGMDTGFEKNDKKYTKWYVRPIKAGMEKDPFRLNDHPDRESNHYIIKNPNIIVELNKLLKRFTIDHMFIPIRNFDEAAKSRAKNQKRIGGLWEATDAESQKLFYYKIMSEYLYIMSKYDIPTTFISFERMIKDPEYLYNKMSFLTKNYSYDSFLSAYKEATGVIQNS